MTREDAYFLGLLATDGNLLIRHYTTKSGAINYYYRMSFSSIDSDATRNVAAYFGGVNVNTRVYDNNKWNDMYQCSYTLTEEEFNWYLSLGLTPSKTYTLNIRSPELLSSADFWRGVVDGDGHFLKRLTKEGRVKDYQFGITTASEAFAHQIADSLGCNIYKSKRDATYNPYLSSKKKIFPLLKRLYEDAPQHIRMERKYEKAMGMLKGES